MTTLTSFELIDVALIEKSPLNPRHKFPKESMDRLVESLRTVGQLDPVTVREISGKAGRFELVNGERRWLAAKEAGVG